MRGGFFIWDVQELASENQAQRRHSHDGKDKEYPAVYATLKPPARRQIPGAQRRHIDHMVGNRGKSYLGQLFTF
jgi:hypothetical protein